MLGERGSGREGMRDEKRKLWRRCPDSAQQPASKPGRLRRSIHLSSSTSPSSLHHPWPSRPSQLRSQLISTHGCAARTRRVGTIGLYTAPSRSSQAYFECPIRIPALGHVCEVLPLVRTPCSHRQRKRRPMPMLNVCLLRKAYRHSHHVTDRSMTLRTPTHRNRDVTSVCVGWNIV